MNQFSTYPKYVEKHEGGEGNQRQPPHHKESYQVATSEECCIIFEVRHLHMPKTWLSNTTSSGEKGRGVMTFSPMTSWIMRLLLETLVMTSNMEVALRSKYSMSYLSITFKCHVHIRIACVSLVLVKQNSSAIKGKIIGKGTIGNKSSFSIDNVLLVDGLKIIS